MQEKGTVGIPNSYFLKMARHDYEDYRGALAREFFQNSIDAGASRVDVSFEKDGDDVLLITVSDDGCGMSLDVLKNKLLVLGGSHKAEGSVGAFGKAKELLFFSWDRYTIHTRDLLVGGTGANYTISKAEPIKGTTCKIWITDAGAKQYTRTYFSTVAGKMQTKTKIYVDGDHIPCIRPRGKLVRELEGVGKLYQVKKRQSANMHVRVKGIWMFDLYVGEGSGELVMELDGFSTDALTSNRDGFKWEVRSKVSRLVEDISVNREAALRKKARQVRKRIKGTGAITVGENMAAMVAAKTSIDQGQNVRHLVEQIFATEEEMSIIQKWRVKNAGEITAMEWDEFEEHIKFIGYEPDFDLLFEDTRADGIQKFMDGKKARTLAMLWTETIKQILIDSKRYLRFTAGFIFEKGIEASLVQENGQTIFYLNPDNIKMSEGRFVVAEDIKDMAIHEIAHLDYSGHNELFVNQMAEVRKIVSRGDQTAYTNIRRTVAK